MPLDFKSDSLVTLPRAETLEQKHRRRTKTQSLILFTCFEENISAPTTTSMFTNFENEDDCVLTVVMLQKIKRKDVHVCLLVVGPRLTYLLVSHIHIDIYIRTQ